MQRGGGAKARRGSDSTGSPPGTAHNKTGKYEVKQPKTKILIFLLICDELKGKTQISMVIGRVVVKLKMIRF